RERHGLERRDPPGAAAALLQRLVLVALPAQHALDLKEQRRRPQLARGQPLELVGAERGGQLLGGVVAAVVEQPLCLVEICRGDGRRECRERYENRCRHVGLLGDLMRNPPATADGSEKGRSLYARGHAAATVC